jgi:uncharacterized phage-associated protein
MIEFPYDERRAKAAVLWLLHQHGGALDKLKLLKLLFFADRGHLAHQARPITGGHYVAMQHGPVHSELYDELRAPPATARWVQVEGHRVIADAPGNEDCLSTSDLEALHAANGKWGHFDGFSLRNITHQLEAWKKNYLGDRSSYPLPYEDFFLDIEPADGVRELLEEDDEDRRALAMLRGDL